MKFIGHTTNWQRLEMDMQNLRLASSMLFYGIPGIGKKRVAFKLASQLLKTKFSDAIDEISHPDFFRIQPIDNKKIKIDELRDLQKKLTKAPLEAPVKVVLIDDAHFMTMQAANSLLKTLEEPPRDTIIILIASNLFQILPTIRSRMRTFYFNAPKIEESVSLISQIKNNPENEISTLLKICDGSIGLTLKCLDGDYKEVLNDVIQLLSSRSSGFIEVSQLVSKWQDAEMDWPLMMEFLKKTCFQHIKENQQWNRLNSIDQIHQAQNDLSRNVNKVLVLENLLIKLKGKMNAEIFHNNSH